ncbi:CHASE2 domain-containing protein, partial [Candidatus Latescibacterota bacterium]
MKQLSSQQKKLVQDAALAVLAVILVSTLSLGGWIDYLNGNLFDLLVTTRHAAPEHRDDIVFATIDQNSITYFNEHNGVSWPWPRVFYARLLRHLADCGARVVVFDIIFSEEDVDRTGEERDASDNEFARAIAETKIAVLAVSDQRDPSRWSVPDRVDWPLDDTVPFDRCTAVMDYRNELLPYYMFLESTPGLGFVTMTPERDGIHRRYPVVSRVGGKLVPSLALTAAKRFLSPEEYHQRVRDPMA